MKVVHIKVEVPADVHHRLKVRAVTERKTLAQLVNEILDDGSQPQDTEAPDGK